MPLAGKTLITGTSTGTGTGTGATAARAFSDAGGPGNSDRPQAPLTETSAERFDSAFGLNLRGASVPPP
ncbi:hypothetical protein LHJ74_23915 [Streptomyces sp. N2-109]|uniref:Uncharacterized protein n=1 Tax=Streptomyces gossypii TaxID=2883101 RepID=A0ABT2JYE8_9ACTN|nr:hypothetical protein [Streptomyces gossypii]MCT2592922.1 hypothetical protein [Streptomyces gossypii]